MARRLRNPTTGEVSATRSLDGAQGLSACRPPMPYCILLVEIDIRTRPAAVRIRILRLLKGGTRSLDPSHRSPGREKFSYTSERGSAPAAHVHLSYP